MTYPINVLFTKLYIQKKTNSKGEEKVNLAHNQKILIVSVSLWPVRW